MASWRLRKDKKGYSHLSYETKISVSQKDGRIVDWLYGNFGGFITIQKSYKNNPEMYQWVINEHKAYDFAKKIYSFLRYKKEQCKLFIRLGERKIISSRQNPNGTFARMNEHEKEIRQYLIDEIKRLKHIWRKSAVLETKRVNSHFERSDSPSL